MADIVVVGAGIGGLAVSARLAKAGHRVTVCERMPLAGGAVRWIERDGFRWDAGATSMTLPATVRDLFRKSGRPLERYVDLQLRTPARRHVFDDGAEVDLPTGSRSAQRRAVAAGLGHAAAEEWTAFVDKQVPLWEILRREVLDRADGGARLAHWRVARGLHSRRTFGQRLSSELSDRRLRQLAAYPVALTGSNPDFVPGYAAAHSYVERSTGVWSLPGAGMGALTDALLTRLRERHVTVHCRTTVVAIRIADGVVCGVETAKGDFLPADVVVTDLSPREVVGALLPRSAMRRFPRPFQGAEPAKAVAVTHLGLRAAGYADLPEEVVLHGSPLVVVNTGGTAPAGQRAWTLWIRDGGDRDVLAVLADRGLDIRGDVVCRIDRSPAEVAAETGGSPFGMADDGYRGAARRARYASPVPGLQLLGAGMHPGPSIPYVVWGAAHVADRIGRA